MYKPLPKIKLVLDPDADGSQWIFMDYIVTKQSHPKLCAYAIYYKERWVEICDTLAEAKLLIGHDMAKFNTHVKKTIRKGE